ncbi:MAG: prepilin-type N-terminal cleavage/methylation domain-containing protein [Candidatus Omnitrophica bacterium]|nr:prepilin-type N-terminal cleavage/methylation domain-containing protein [Candidatus Omnitrophota bacterium]
MKLRKYFGKGGFTLVEIMIVVAIIGLLAAIAIPNFVQARTRAQRGACIANLRQIDGAKTLYALDNNLASGDACAMTDLVPLYIQRTPICPAGGTYTPGTIAPAGDPTCSVHGALQTLIGT